ncbi:MAG: anhydro-N-acetylmuramic acid kinase [Alphaproteobacteria bacterium]|nr:anhydro-N-acetylmuramic acid kinase [Alphaproteobacteria bacterium]
MNAAKVYTAIGLMSGTSLDGEIDVALIRTDGHDFVEALAFQPFPYAQDVRDKVRECFGKRAPDKAVLAAEKLVTNLHIAAVRALGQPADIIGFHGQTLTHDPAAGFTWQIGDGAAMARATGIDTISDFRSADMRAGGQGAPLIPLYHRAIMARAHRPVAVLNLGGVANITFIDENNDLIAFDTGPANALMDDMTQKCTGAAFDENGKMARNGRVDNAVVEAFLTHDYFQKSGPKSLDRNAWDLDCVAHLNPNDALATLCEMTVRGVKAALDNLPLPPCRLYACGGGRKNDFLMTRLNALLPFPVLPVEDAGWNGDAIEAQGFAYLAVRSLLGLPLSLPSTTGVPAPITGGVLFRADEAPEKKSP